MSSSSDAIEMRASSASSPALPCAAGDQGRDSDDEFLRALEASPVITGESHVAKTRVEQPFTSFLKRPDVRQEELDSGFRFAAHDRKAAELPNKRLAGAFVQDENNPLHVAPQPSKFFIRPTWLANPTIRPMAAPSRPPSDETLRAASMPHRLQSRTVEDIRKTYQLKVPQMTLSTPAAGVQAISSSQPKVMKPAVLMPMFRRKSTSTHHPTRVTQDLDSVALGTSPKHPLSRLISADNGLPTHIQASLSNSDPTSPVKLPLCNTLGITSKYDQREVTQPSTNDNCRSNEDIPAQVSTSPQQDLSEYQLSPLSAQDSKATECRERSAGLDHREHEEVTTVLPGIDAECGGNIQTLQRDQHSIMPQLPQGYGISEHRLVEHQIASEPTQSYARVGEVTSPRTPESPSHTIATTWRADRGSKVTKSKTRLASSSADRAGPMTFHDSVSLIAGTEGMDHILSSMHQQVAICKRSTLHNAEELERKSRLVTQLEQEREVMQSEIRSRQRETDAEKRLYQEFRRKVAVLQDKSSRLGSTLNSLGISFSELKALGQETKDDCQQTRAAVNELRGTLSDSQELVKKSTLRIDRIKTNAQQIIAEAAHENDTLQRTIEHLRHELDQVTGLLVTEKDRAARVDAHLLADRTMGTDVKEVIEKLVAKIDTQLAKLIATKESDMLPSEAQRLFQRCLDALVEMKRDGKVGFASVERMIEEVSQTTKVSAEWMGKLVERQKEASGDRCKFQSDTEASIRDLASEVQGVRASGKEAHRVWQDFPVFTQKQEALRITCEQLTNQLSAGEREKAAHQEIVAELQQQLAEAARVGYRNQGLEEQILGLKKDRIELEKKLSEARTESERTRQSTKEIAAMTEERQSRITRLQKDIDIAQQELLQAKVYSGDLESKHVEEMVKERLLMEALTRQRISDLTSEHSNKLRQSVVACNKAQQDGEECERRRLLTENLYSKQTNELEECALKLQRLSADNDLLRHRVEALGIEKLTGEEVEFAGMEGVRAPTGVASQSTSETWNRVGEVEEQISSLATHIRSPGSPVGKLDPSTEIQPLNDSVSVEQAVIQESEICYISSEFKKHVASPTRQESCDETLQQPRVRACTPSSPGLNHRLTTESLFQHVSSSICGEESALESGFKQHGEDEEQFGAQVNAMTAPTEQDQNDESRFFSDAFSQLEDIRKSSDVVEAKTSSPLSDLHDPIAPRGKPSKAAMLNSVGDHLLPKSILKRPLESLLSDDADERSSQTSTSNDLPFGGKHNRGLQTYGSITRKNTFAVFTDHPRRRTTTDRATDYFRGSSNTTNIFQQPLQAATMSKQPSMASQAMQNFSSKPQPGFLETVSTPSRKVQANETRPITPKVQSAAKRGGSAVIGHGKSTKKQRFSSEVR